MNLECKICNLHSGIEKQIEALHHKIEEGTKLVNVQFTALEKALDLARLDMERRLEGMNEFRAQLSHQAGTFISAKEVSLLLDKLSIRMENIEKCTNTEVGSTKWKDHLVTVGIAALIFFIFHYVFKF